MPKFTVTIGHLTATEVEELINAIATVCGDHTLDETVITVGRAE